jgi:hypothetical protein
VVSEELKAVFPTSYRKGLVTLRNSKKLILSANFTNFQELNNLCKFIDRINLLSQLFNPKNFDSFAKNRFLEVAINFRNPP